ncbi:hypothetical protein FHS86_002151 [Roseimarinus sediminis]|jgi:hypothetical protein
MCITKHFAIFRILSRSNPLLYSGFFCSLYHFHTPKPHYVFIPSAYDLTRIDILRFYAVLPLLSNPQLCTKLNHLIILLKKTYE